MLQQVNLLAKDLVAPKEIFDLRQTLWGVVFVLGVLAMVAGSRGWELAELLSKANTLQAELSQIGVSNATTGSNSDVAAQIAQLESTKATLLAQAATLREARRLTGFSEEIRMLSESSVAGLWLTEFSMLRSSNGDPTLNLAGRTHQPAAVGEYVEALKAHGGLAGYTFADIELLSHENESTFRLIGELRETDAIPD